MARFSRLSFDGVKNPQRLKYGLDKLMTEAEGADADLQDQIDAITDLNSDDLLTPSKKPMWIFMYSAITAEQAGLDAQATSYGITTEKTTYDTAVSALTTYLATLTTDVAWNNLTGNTTIVGTTLRTKFNDVLAAKQALINAITAAAKVLADAAAADAAAADAAAAAAQADATDAIADAATAQVAADAVKLTDKISGSATAPSNSLTAADVGTDVTITIASHTRLYGDNTTLAITGGTLTGKAFSTTYGVYYDDATCADTTPNFVATTTLKNAMPNAANGRHFVGQVTTPADGGGGTSGGYTPPGGGGPYP